MTVFIRRGLVPIAVALLVLMALLPKATRAQTPNPLQDVGIRQNLDQQIPGDLSFRDESGKTVKLAHYFHDDRPIVLALIYYRCPVLCTVVLNNLVQGLKNVPMDAGAGYRVLTVSFDPSDTPPAAAAKKANTIDQYLSSPPPGATPHDRTAAEAGWTFLTGTQPSITALTQAAGFRYRWDESSNQFIHPSGLLVLSPTGRITRYFFGINYQPNDLRLALLDAGGNKIAPPTDQILLYCFHYNPSTGRYTLAISRAMKAGGAAIVLTLALAVAGLFYVDHRKTLAGLKRPKGGR